ncbi:DUF3429 domain-containing protein [Rhodopila sp.]|uniref:DUF3429 domain-containing protein n=1 Tax=Rhodopila sp. TaxID=2480087 RepID=UPI003D09F16F
MRPPIPRAVLAYGLLGVIPFLAPPAAGVLFPDIRPLSAVVLSLYGGLILSFLGGARWGAEIRQPAPRPWIITLAMLPTLVALALLLLPSAQRRGQLLGLAVALGVHWLWDLRGADLPTWYTRLRTPLTLGAAAGLIAGAIVLTA